MFLGMHEKKVDAKGRVGIPIPFRSLLPEEDSGRIWLVKGSSGQYLEVWPASAWETFCQEVMDLPGVKQRLKLLRGYVSQAVEGKLDREGRVVVPPLFREFGGLEKQVLWIGVGSRMELWSKGRFEEEDDNLRAEADEVLTENEENFSG